MKPQVSRPALFSVKGGEIPLSGPALIELLNAVLDKGVPFRFRAKGYSMFPFIRDGDVVTVSALPGDSYRIGDVAAFIPPDSKNLVVHRVVGKRNSLFLMRGDNMPSFDGLIPKANILACVTKVERRGKEVCLGLGPERLLIAFLARIGFLSPLMLCMQKLAHLAVRR